MSTLLEVKKKKAGTGSSLGLDAFVVLTGGVPSLESLV
jgi:hypothetical protein